MNYPAAMLAAGRQATGYQEQNLERPKAWGIKPLPAFGGNN